MAAPQTWAVLLPIRKQHAANIYAGTKTVELRKTVPRFAPPDSWEGTRYSLRVYMYESKADGGAGAITGFFDCPAFIGVKPEPGEKYHPSFAQRAQVSPGYVEEYGGGGWVYGWEVKRPTRLPEPVALAAIGIDHAPQSWRYLEADACKVLEVAARGSPAE